MNIERSMSAGLGQIHRSNLISRLIAGTIFKTLPEVDGLVAPNYDPRCMIQTELDVLRDVSGRLTSGGVAFMLTGSMAMNYYAQPRMTRS